MAPFAAVLRVATSFPSTTPYPLYILSPAVKLYECHPLSPCGWE